MTAYDDDYNVIPLDYELGLMNDQATNVSVGPYCMIYNAPIF